jgi:hypothetical protein
MASTSAFEIGFAGSETADVLADGAEAPDACPWPETAPKSPSPPRYQGRHGLNPAFASPSKPPCTITATHFALRLASPSPALSSARAWLRDPAYPRSSGDEVERPDDRRAETRRWTGGIAPWHRTHQREAVIGPAGRHPQARPAPLCPLCVLDRALCTATAEPLETLSRLMGLTARSDSSPIPPRCSRAPTGKTPLPRGFVFWFEMHG